MTEIKCEVRPVLALFADEMEKVLKANDYKGGWDSSHCSCGFLEDRLIQELGEYFKSRDVKELCDIANFAMMLWSRRKGMPVPILC